MQTKFMKIKFLPHGYATEYLVTTYYDDGSTEETIEPHTLHMYRWDF